jgi:hypothetical protein
MLKVQVQDLTGDWYDITGPLAPTTAKAIVRKTFGAARAVAVQS